MPPLLRSAAAAFRRPGPWLPITAATAWLAWTATRRVLAATGGEPAVPLDDAFIHFQFARTFAELRPFQYSPGFPAVAGATSLLWPLLLAPFHALGLRGLSLIWAAWAGGWLALGLLANETWHLARGLLSRTAAAAAAAMVLAFGGHVWCAASGMEVIPLAWLLMRAARRAAEHAEGSGPTSHAARRELLALAFLAPAMRPEGTLASLLLAATLAAFPRGASRAWALCALAGALLPGSVNWLATGDFSTTTVTAKWLFFTPYPARIAGTLRYHLDVLFNTLMNGEVWSSVFVPRGSRWASWLALPALVWAATSRRRAWRGGAALVVALGVLIPTTYDSFLVNRLRYLWPFTAAWFVGLAALADAAGAVAGRVRLSPATARALVGGAFVGWLAGHLDWTFDDLTTSARAIRDQQVALARWADAELPPDATLGVNDAGALAYLSRRRTFDLVGLTTQGEARHWNAGAGSRFEHYERLGATRLPTHLVVYDRWLTVPPILGEYLTQRYVPGATILGDATMTAYVARWDALDSGALPDGVASSSIVDEVDVADLESERAHGYRLLDATQMQDVVAEADDGRVDGGRTERREDRFVITVRPGARWIARWVASGPVRVEASCAGHRAEWELVGDGSWEERSWRLPAELPAGTREVVVRALSPATFGALHYWVAD